MTQIEYLIQLKELGTLPDDMTIDYILKSNGSNIDNIVEEMISHEEFVWHKMCRSGQMIGKLLCETGCFITVKSSHIWREPVSP